MVLGPGGISPGTNLNRLMDTLGFPDKMSDMYGAALDSAVGNNLGVACNLFDAFSPLSTTQLDRIMGGGFASPGQIARPFTDYGRHFATNMHSHYSRENISSYNLGPLGLGGKGFEIDGKTVAAGPQFKGMKPAEFEKELMGNPALRSKVEAQLGGRIVYDGKADGKITVGRPMHHPCIPYHNSINQHVGSLLNRCFQPPMLGNMLGSLGNALSQMG